MRDPKTEANIPLNSILRQSFLTMFKENITKTAESSRNPTSPLPQHSEEQLRFDAGERDAGGEPTMRYDMNHDIGLTR